MKKGWKRWLALGLAVLTTVSLTACGGSGDGENSRGGEFVYVPEYISLGSGENTHISQYSYADGKLYYMQYEYGEASYEEYLVRYDPETGEKEKITLEGGDIPESASQDSMAIDADGNLYVLWRSYTYNELNPENSRQEYLLAKYDASGSNLFTSDITEEIVADEENSWVQSMLLDEKGRIYLVSSTVVRFYSDQGAYQGEVRTDNWMDSSFTGKDGKVYISYFSYEGDGPETVVAPIDFEGKKLGDACHIPSGGSVSVSAGLEKDFLITVEDTVYEYDIESGTQEELMRWMDSDINSDYVQMVRATEDGRLLVVLNDWSTNETELAFLTKTKASDLPEKEEIVIGTFYRSQGLQASAVAFNKSSSQYHITIKSYYDYSSGVEYDDVVAQMNNDITSDKCPDILELDSGSGVFNLEQLTAKGMFEDLAPYLEKSSVLSRDDYIESVLKAYTFNGTLIGIPKSFQLSAVAGKTSQVGDKMGWSIKDIMEFSAANPGAELFEYASQGEIMNMMMIFNQDAFIDWENGTCNFDSEEFRQMLEFAAGFPEEYDWDSEGDSTPTKLATGKLLLYSDSISNCRDIQVAEAMFNEPVTYIGFPTIDGSAGCVMLGEGAYGITTKSSHKDGAWAFIEYYLNREDDWFSYGLPSNKERLEAEIAEASKAEYVLDENGEPLLDENGAPIYEGMGGFGYDDWHYTYHPCTEEENAKLWELIDTARPMQMNNSEVLSIIMEEAAPYYKGEKSLDEVVGLIQSRISMYVGENS